jgi:hypothetical protein
MERDWVAIAGRVMGETQLSLAAASRLLLATRGTRVATSTLRRWVLAGKRGVFLDAYCGPGKSWTTSREALARFLGAVSAGRSCRPEVVPATVLARRAAEAMRELRRIPLTSQPEK